jgi:hypothetical protein
MQLAANSLAKDDMIIIVSYVNPLAYQMFLVPVHVKYSLFLVDFCF